MEREITTNIMNSLKTIDLNSSENMNIDQGERGVSIAAGSYLFFKGIKNLYRHPVLGLLEAATGGFLLYRGATGVCPVYKKLGRDTTDPEAINITERITVNVSRQAAYDFWRNLSNLPKFMTHLKSVDEEGTRSHWVANTPGNLVALSWNAEITREEDGNYIGWQSVEGSMIDNAGRVQFTDSLNGTGTEIQVDINYFPPAGSVGRGLTTLFNGVFEKMIREDIQNFKEYAEREDFKTFAGLGE
ncbi:MAG: cyclase [Pedobacter sp.]|jgi:uncharacterized membrane protein|nr:cyclase [Pedobacter sp.]